MLSPTKTSGLQCFGTRKRFFICNINNTGLIMDPCCNSTVGGKGSDTYGILNFNDFLTL